MDRAIRLLERIRRSVNILYISGGEPLVHPHLIEILRAAKKLEFASIGMSSNLLTLHRKMEVLDLLDAISVSIHAPDLKLHAENLAVPEHLAQRTFDNLNLINNHPRRAELKLIVNCVMNASNLHRVLEMVEFTRQNGCLLELAPANDHGRPAADLDGNPDYIRLIDKLIAMRRAGTAKHVAGSTAYYRRIRDFKPYRCFPYGVANIMPDGRLCTPCDVSEQYAVNILDHESLKEAVRASKPFLGNYPCTEGRCFKAGIVERSLLFGAMTRHKKPGAMTGAIPSRPAQRDG